MSMTDPPPTARKAVGLYSFAKSIASRMLLLLFSIRTCQALGAAEILRSVLWLNPCSVKDGEIDSFR